MLFDGCAKGQRLLPEGWMERSVIPAPTLRLHAVDRRDGDSNGRSIWLNRALGEHGETAPPWPSAPEDTYAAMGHWKQAIVVIPSLDLVIARTGDDRDGSYEWDTLLGLVTALVSADQPVHPVVSAVGTAENTLSPSRDEDMGLLGIATGYGAKMACSCAFVMGRDEDFCEDWVKASPDIVKVRFDHDAKTVTARALGMKATTASWGGKREGCSLEP
jgi:CubicO group peptidase (beta-lactamase class C family)